MRVTWEEIERLFSGMLGNSQDDVVGLFHGPPGTSKTHTATHMGLQPGEPIWLLSLSEEQLAAELRGTWMPNEQGGAGWFDGPCVKWWKEGGRLILDELDKVSADADSFLRVVLNDADVAFLTLPTGETVRKNPSPRWKHSVVATMNGTPEDLSEALRNRLLPAFEITVPHPGAFLTLPEQYRAPARAAFKTQDAERYVSLREWQKFSKLVVGMGDEDLAARAVLGDFGPGFVDSLKLARGGDATTEEVPSENSEEN